MLIYERFSSIHFVVLCTIAVLISSSLFNWAHAFSIPSYVLIILFFGFECQDDVFIFTVTCSVSIEMTGTTMASSVDGSNGRVRHGVQFSASWSRLLLRASLACAGICHCQTCDKSSSLLLCGIKERLITTRPRFHFTIYFIFRTHIYLIILLLSSGNPNTYESYLARLAQLLT